MYESPIELIFNSEITKLEKQEEELILSACMSVDVNVNKEELIKALQYDRGQYEKGFADGRNADKWISVERELPPKGEFVLATTSWNDVTIAENLGGGNWFIHEGDSNATDEDIIAWQPLPKPYNPL